MVHASLNVSARVTESSIYRIIVSTIVMVRASQEKNSLEEKNNDIIIRTHLKSSFPTH